MPVQLVLHCDGGALVLLSLGTFPRANLGATVVQYGAVTSRFRERVR